MITWLIWTTRTSMSAVRERLLILITYSLIGQVMCCCLMATNHFIYPLRTSESMWSCRSRSTPAWWHQTITWNNVDLLSVRSSNNQLRALSQEIPQPSLELSYHFEIWQALWKNFEHTAQMFGTSWDLRRGWWDNSYEICHIVRSHQDTAGDKFYRDKATSYILLLLEYIDGPW